MLCGIISTTTGMRQWTETHHSARKFTEPQQRRCANLGRRCSPSNLSAANTDSHIKHLVSAWTRWLIRLSPSQPLENKRSFLSSLARIGKGRRDSENMSSFERGTTTRLSLSRFTKKFSEFVVSKAMHESSKARVVLWLRVVASLKPQV